MVIKINGHTVWPVRMASEHRGSLTITISDDEEPAAAPSEANEGLPPVPPEDPVERDWQPAPHNPFADRALRDELRARRKARKR